MKRRSRRGAEAQRKRENGKKISKLVRLLVLLFLRLSLSASLRLSFLYGSKKIVLREGAAEAQRKRGT